MDSRSPSGATQEGEIGAVRNRGKRNGRTKTNQKREQGEGGGIDDRDRNGAARRAERGAGSESLGASVGSRCFLWLSRRASRVVAVGRRLGRGATENSEKNRKTKLNK